MKKLNVDMMRSAVKNVISLCGIDVLADPNRFRSAMMDYMQGGSLNTELQLLVFTVRIDIGKRMLKGVDKSAAKQKQILIAVFNELSAEFGFSESRSNEILQVFVSALGWNKEDIPKRAEPLIMNRILQQGEAVQADLVKFGKYKWRILYVRSGMALLLADEITDVGIPYHNILNEVSWEESTVREWLNTEFLDRFSKRQQRRIVRQWICAENNPWYQTSAGVGTEDKVFLLSITEAVRSFGDSGQLIKRPQNMEIWSDTASIQGLSRAIDDEYNDKRQAIYQGERTWWWLRSPGDSRCKAAYVNADGVIILNGELVSDDGGPNYAEIRPGIRPAIWLQT